MEHLPRPSTLAWAALFGGVALYDLVIAPEGETMSDGFWDSLERPVGKYLAAGALAVTAAHLMEALPDRIDPFKRVFGFVKGRHEV